MAATAAAGKTIFGVKAANFYAGASAAMSAVGALRSGQAAQNSAKFNAEMLRRQEARQRQINALNAKRKRADNEAIAAKQRALLAGQGRDATSGSALLLQEDLAEEGEFNARLIENQGAADVAGTQARRILALSEGRNAKQASFFRAGSTLLKAGQAFA